MSETGNSTKATPEVKAPRYRWGTRLVGYVKRKVHERRAKKQHEEPADRAARRTASATVWIAIFTVILALVGGLTLYEVIAGGSDTHTLAEAAKKQAGVASYALCETQRNNLIQQRLADANRVSAENSSTSSLGATIKNSDLDQRAWIGVERVDGVPELNKQFVISVMVKNTGKTFAKHVVMSAMEEGMVDELPLRFDRETAHIKANSITLITPNGEYNVRVRVTGEGPDPHIENPDQSGLDRIKSGAFKIYVHGRIDYEDVFRQKHWTIYCFRLQNGGWASCQGHNDADNNGLTRSPAQSPQSQPIVEPPPCPKQPN